MLASLVQRPAIRTSGRKSPDYTTEEQLQGVVRATQALFTRVRRSLSVAVRDIDQTVDQLVGLFDRHGLRSLEAAARSANGDFTAVHSVSVGLLMAALAQGLGLGPALRRRAAAAGLLHDIGKALVPCDIIDKRTCLDAAESDVMRTHPRLGGDALKSVEGLDAAIVDVALHHHERLDGAGYPDGLEARRLGLLVRMASICDVYDALTAERSYKGAWTSACALQQLEDGARAGQFDPDIFGAFRALVARRDESSDGKTGQKVIEESL